MPPNKGRIVCSAAGRDKGKFMIIMDFDGNMVKLCDGKEHPIERQKSKNIKHVFLTNAYATEQQLKTNRSIRHALNDFKANNAKGEI